MSFIKGHKRSQLDLDSVVHKRSQLDLDIVSFIKGHNNLDSVTSRSRYDSVIHKKVTIRSRYSVVHKRSQLDLDI